MPTNGTSYLIDAFRPMSKEQKGKLLARVTRDIRFRKRVNAERQRKAERVKEANGRPHQTESR